MAEILYSENQFRARPDLKTKKIQYDGVVIWAEGNDASKNENRKKKYTRPKDLHEQISQVFQICVEKLPRATQCFIGIPPKTTLQLQVTDYYADNQWTAQKVKYKKRDERCKELEAQNKILIESVIS